MTLNFIDRQFVLNLFDEQLLLRRVDPVLDQIVDSIIPKFDQVTNKYSTFYKLQLDHIATKSKQNSNIARDFEETLQLATNRFKELRDKEQKVIE